MTPLRSSLKALENRLRAAAKRQADPGEVADPSLAARRLRHLPLIRASDGDVAVGFVGFGFPTASDSPVPTWLRR